MKIDTLQSFIDSYGESIDNEIAKSDRCVRFFNSLSQAGPYVRKSAETVVGGAFVVAMLGPALLGGVASYVFSQVATKIHSYFWGSRETSKVEAPVSQEVRNQSPGYRSRNRRTPTPTNEFR